MPRDKLKVVTDACCKIKNANVPGRRIKGPSACGVIILDTENNVIKKVSKYLGELTPPQAEYQAVLIGLDLASGECRKEIELWSDSELVVRQMNGDYCIKSDNIKPLFDKAKTMERRFSVPVKYNHHSRSTKLAQEADKLANEEYIRNNS